MLISLFKLTHGALNIFILNLWHAAIKMLWLTLNELQKNELSFKELEDVGYLN